MPAPALDLAVLALATARLTRLVTTDTITERVRERVWRRFGGPGESLAGYVITCNWCVSIYASSLLTAWYMMSEKSAITVSTILALSMAAGFLANRAE